MTSVRTNPLPSFPVGIVEFSQTFPDEKACQAYLFAVRWPDGFVCPKCGSNKAYSYDEGAAFQCAKHHITSLTAGTAMHKTKQALQTWFWAAYFISTHTQGMSAVQFQKHLRIPRYETAFQLLHKMRSTLVAPEREPLHGVIEMDETYILNTNQEKVIIIGAIEVRERFDPHAAGYSGGGLLESRPTVVGRLRLRVIPDETAMSFLDFATKNVLRGASIHTDGDPSYNALTSLGYVHQAKVQGKGKAAIYGLEHIHRAFSNLKTWLSGTHHDAVLPKHMQAYCNEFVYRHNRRGNPWAAFNRCLGLVSHATERPEYETLYAAGEEGGWVHPNPRVDAAAYAKLCALAEADGMDRLAEWMAVNRAELMSIWNESEAHRRSP